MGSLISATGCNSCALENVKLHTSQSNMFLVGSKTFPKSIPQLMKAQILGMKVCESGRPRRANEGL